MKKKRYKYLELIREQRKLWNISVTVIPMVTGILGTVPKRLERGLQELEIRGRIEAIQTTALLRSARIARKVLETWKVLLSLILQWTTISWRWCEELKRSEIIIIIEDVISVCVHRDYYHFWREITIKFDDQIQYKQLIQRSQTILTESFALELNFLSILSHLIYVNPKVKYIYNWKSQAAVFW